MTVSLKAIKNLISQIRNAGDNSAHFSYIESIYDLLPSETQSALYQNLQKELEELQSI